MAPRFGTDGLRGEANVELTPEVALALGRAVVEVLGADRVVIGSDPRISSPMLEAALTAGVLSSGGSVEPLGVVPTPAVAWAAADRGAAGAMISASHNPFGDNGIKVFAPGGLKLSDEVEAEIQARYLAHLAGGAADTDRANGPELGRVLAPGSVEGWVDLVVGSVRHAALEGMSVVLDCANGAASDWARPVFERLGADVIVIGDQPDGVNINEGVGSTHPQSLQAKVVEVGADAGLAFDGDADRLIAVDETGTLVDGDRVIGVLAQDWAADGRLNDNTVVVTVMTNLGFHQAMAEGGIKVVSTTVGDRNVLAALDEQGLSLGGEQSGHVICRDLATTGDGILTGVQLLDVVARSDHSLGRLAADLMTTVPQVLENVRLPAGGITAAEVGQAITAEVADVVVGFGDDGRVLVRPSGTEPLLRIMVEHIDEQTAHSACRRLVAAAQAAVGDGG